MTSNKFPIVKINKEKKIINIICKIKLKQT